MEACVGWSLMVGIEGVAEEEAFGVVAVGAGDESSTTMRTDYDLYDIPCL